MLIATRPTLARLCLIDRLLASDQGLSLRRFAEEYEVSRRTLVRDLDWIRYRLGCQLVRRGGVWRYEPGHGPIFTEAVHARAL